MASLLLYLIQNYTTHLYVHKNEIFGRFFQHIVNWSRNEKVEYELSSIANIELQ